MLSGQIGQYKYYELKDMRKSIGCKLCSQHIFHKMPKQIDPFKLQHEQCTRCPIFMAVQLTKLYAEQLANYEERYIDDGR